MLDSPCDFFTFSTRLKPVELAALGRLSEVVHFPADATIYHPGEASDAIYSINRGIASVYHSRAEDGAGEAPDAYLSRGDIFGAVGVLSGQPRRRRIRCCEEVSAQRFPAENLDELQELVPGFFRFLSQKLAQDVVAGSEKIQSNCIGLSGTLDNFDLVAVFQTIMHSAQTGELIIRCSEEVQARLFFEEGQVRRAVCQHLRGEEAFFQIFLLNIGAGRFEFARRVQSAALACSPRIEVAPEDLLLRAMKMQDEYNHLQSALPEPDEPVRLGSRNLEEELPEPAKTLAERCADEPVTLEALYKELPFCRLKVSQSYLDVLEQQG